MNFLHLTYSPKIYPYASIYLPLQIWIPSPGDLSLNQPPIYYHQYYMESSRCWYWGKKGARFQLDFPPCLIIQLQCNGQMHVCMVLSQRIDHIHERSTNGEWGKPMALYISPTLPRKRKKNTPPNSSAVDGSFNLASCTATEICRRASTCFLGIIGARACAFWRGVDSELGLVLGRNDLNNLRGKCIETSSPPNEPTRPISLSKMVFVSCYHFACRKLHFNPDSIFLTCLSRSGEAHSLPIMRNEELSLGVNFISGIHDESGQVTYTIDRPGFRSEITTWIF